MASLTGGFAPIAGAGTKDKGGAKKSDPTSGLISLGSGGAATRSESDDLDFSDFDVDDLLLDEASSGSKSKSKSKNKSPPSSPKKKKSSSGSSSKKKKDKKKSNGGALDFLNEEDNDWDKDDDNVAEKKTRKPFDELDEVTVPAKKKNARLDDEFARMLGLEDDFADHNTVSSVENGGDDFGDSPVKRDTFAPASQHDEPKGQSVVKHEDISAPPPQPEDSVIEDTGALNASFFQDDSGPQTSKATSGDDSILSFLSSSDRRGGRNGRRGGATAANGDDTAGKSMFADPFVKNNGGGGVAAASRRTGGLDELFSSSRTAAKSTRADPSEVEPLPATKEQPVKSTFASLFGGDADSKTNGSEESASVKPVPRSLPGAMGSSKPATIGSAKDDLLSELFPAETPRVATKKTPSPKKDESLQHDDLLAELFPDEVKKAPRRRDPEPTQNAAQANAAAAASPSSPLVPMKPVESAKPEPLKLNDAAPPSADSARDSLLKDLFPESPGSRRSVKWADETTDKATSATPVKTVRESSDVAPPAPSRSTKNVPPDPSPPPSRSPPVVAAPEPSPSKQTPSPVKPLIAAKSESPLPSPGKTKTLTLGTPSKVREVEFEQSKDDLLEEILSSAPPSPVMRSPDPAASRSRLSSYSLSFDQDPLKTGTQPNAPLMSSAPVQRRLSRSPEKQDHQTAAAVTAPVTQTVFLRDVHAEEELEMAHAAAIAELETRHAEALARATTDALQLQTQLQQEQAKAATQAAVCTTHTLQIQQLRDQLAEANAVNARLSGEVQSLQTQHTLQQTQCDLFDSEKAALVRQLSLADEQQRAIVTQLADEKRAHQQTQLVFTTFKRETEQAAQLRTEKERAQMDRLYHQLQNSLAQLTILQEQGTEEATAKRELEAATRLRMISSLESTSRGYVQQTQDECHRLTSFLSSLEATLRAYRQEHLEEKERLRQEQMRLNVLAQHFQAQTSVLNEKSDANAQLLAQHLGASLHDTRAAESRLALRRQQLAEDEQKLYGERALFATHREAWLEQRQRDAAELDAQRTAIEREWRALQRERDDLDDVIASHEDAFRALQQQQLALEAEKDRVAVGALRVAEMAQKFEALTKQIVHKEHEIQQQRSEMDELRCQWTARDQSIANERRKLDEREARLHAQLKQMETARRKMNDERRQQLQHLQSQQRARAGLKTGSDNQDEAMATVRAHVTLASNSSVRSAPFHAPSMMQFTSSIASQPRPPVFMPDPVKSVATAPLELDPSGFSPSFRQLVEENWKKQAAHSTDAALHKERMAIHCLSLDTTARSDTSRNWQDDRLDKRPTPSSTTMRIPSTTNGSRPPPPPSAVSSPSLSTPRTLSVQL